MAADNQPELFKMGFHLIEFILLCDKKILTAKANGQFYLHSCIFGVLCYIYMWTLSTLMYGHHLALVLHELLSN